MTGILEPLFAESSLLSFHVTGFFIVDRSLLGMSCSAEMNDSGSSLSDMKISIKPEIIIASCYAKPAKKPTDKTPLGKRRYIPLSSVQPMYHHRAKVTITHTPGTPNVWDACIARREVYCQSSPSALLRKNWWDHRLIE
jgi:hypothetical protein